MKYYGISALVVVLDQTTKYLADSHLDYRLPVNVFPGLNMTLVYNEGRGFQFSQRCRRVAALVLHDPVHRDQHRPDYTGCALWIKTDIIWRGVWH